MIHIDLFLEIYYHVNAFYYNMNDKLERQQICAIKLHIQSEFILKFACIWWMLPLKVMNTVSIYCLISISSAWNATNWVFQDICFSISIIWKLYMLQQMKLFDISQSNIQRTFIHQWFFFCGKQVNWIFIGWLNNSSKCRYFALLWSKCHCTRPT